MPRKAVEGGAGKRVPLNMKTTQEIRAKLEEAAASSGRSLTSETEHRLMMSFEWEEARGTVKDWLAQSRGVVDSGAAANSARLGWAHKRTPFGRVWLEPGTPEDIAEFKQKYLEPEPARPPAAVPDDLESVIERAVERAVLRALDAPKPKNTA